MRKQADAFLDNLIKESKEVHFRRIKSLEDGTNPIKSYIDSFLFKLKCSLLLLKFKNLRFFMWKRIRNDVKNGYPYYLSRHYYDYDKNNQLFTIKMFRFLLSIEGAVLSFRKGDDNYKIMIENDKKSKKYKRELYLTLLDRFLYINIFVIRKSMILTEKIIKKKIEYIMNDNVGKKDNTDD